MAKILKQQISVWVTTDGAKHFTAGQAREHQQKIDAVAALAHFFHETDISTLFGAEDYTPAEQAAKDLINDPDYFAALLRFVDKMNQALEPTEENKF